MGKKYAAIGALNRVLALAAPLLHPGGTTAEDPVWSRHEFAELLEQHRDAGRRYLKFLDVAAMSAGLYRLDAGAEDPQQPHDLDEVYYVVEGSATLDIAGRPHPVGPGSIAFVGAEVSHRFVDIGEDLAVLVVFATAEGSPSDPDGATYRLQDFREAANPERNDWNEFLTVGSFRLGLYSLPRQPGGDEPLTHEVDEVNIVVKGEARFEIGDDATRVAPGSIVYVPAGRPHAFRDLGEDFEVLILFTGNFNGR